MPKQGRCEIAVLVDRSGSMQSIAADMCGGFDKFINKQKEIPGECQVTLTQFDSQGIDIVLDAVPLEKVGPLVLVPRGMTPLLDALGRTINRVGKRLADMPEEERPDRVLFLILTDGQENASTEFTQEAIKGMVDHQTSVYKWEFVYLGANVDAFAEARTLGVQNAMNFAPTARGVNENFVAVSAGVERYRSAIKPDAYQITPEEREKVEGEIKKS